MRIRYFAGIAYVLLSACSSASDRAEQDFAMLNSTSPDGRELCAAKRKIADAYLADRKPLLDYQLKKLEAGYACRRAASDEMYALIGEKADDPKMQADNLDAMVDNALAE